MTQGNTYWSRYRPFTYASLPTGIRWDFVEAPQDGSVLRVDLPTSSYRYGVIGTDRALTNQELATYDLVAL